MVFLHNLFRVLNLTFRVDWRFQPDMRISEVSKMIRIAITKPVSKLLDKFEVYLGSTAGRITLPLIWT